MANQYDDYEDDDISMQDQNGPANLRKALKRAEKERETLKAELDQFRAERRTSAIKSVLETEGVNGKIAAFIPNDVSTPEQVKSWLAEYADVFGGAKTQEPAPQETEPDPRAAAQARMNGAISGAQSEPEKHGDLLKKVQGVTSRAELDALTGNQPARFQR